MLKRYSIYLIIFFCCSSCSISNQIYLAREKLSDNRTWNFIVTVDNDSQASVIKLQKTKNELIREEYSVRKIKDKLYKSDEMIVNFSRNDVVIEMPTDKVLAHRIKQKNKETTLCELTKLFDENYIVWANHHQITYHDLRQDSITYIYRNSEKTPYKTEKWHLIEIGHEYFLSINSSSNSISRIQIKNGSIFQTICSKSGSKENVITLEKKHSDRR